VVIFLYDKYKSVKVLDSIVDVIIRSCCRPIYKPITSLDLIPCLCLAPEGQ
jgi:hypothetical protein